MIRTGISCEGGARTGCGSRVQGGRSTGQSAGGRQRFGGPDESWGLKACGWIPPECGRARVGRVRISMRGAARRRDRVDQGYERTAVQPPRPAGGAPRRDPVARHGHDPAGRTALIRQHGAHLCRTTHDPAGRRRPTTGSPRRRARAYGVPLTADRAGRPSPQLTHDASHVGGASHSAVGPASPPTAEASGAARPAPHGPAGGPCGDSGGKAPREAATSPLVRRRRPGWRTGHDAPPRCTRDRRPARTHTDPPDAPDRHRQ